MSNHTSTKLHTVHPVEPSITLVGILEQLAYGQPTQGRKIALILHGWIGHKDYLFQKKLAASLPLDSFRFDFRGNHESGGVGKQGNLADDIEDLQAVVDYLKATFGYVIDLVVAHSRASVIAFRWLATTDDGRKVGGFVNASGRYRMPKIMESADGVIWKDHFEKQGFFRWNVKVARRPITATVTLEDIQKFSSWDTSFVWDKFPDQTDVLSIHGLSDRMVPPYDALIYTKALSRRSQGTHTLYMMEDADHNFTGRQEDVVHCILQWLDRRQRGRISTGIWVPEIKGKL